MSKLLKKIERLNRIMAIQNGISNEARNKLIEHNNKLERLVKKLHLPVVTNHVKLNAKQPFTEEEAEIMQLLVRAHNKFIGLRNTHKMETTEWVQSFHKLQDLLGARVLRRDYPDTFHSI